MIPFSDVPLDYNVGREQVPADEVAQNNTDEMDAKNVPDKHEGGGTSVDDLLSQGFSYLNTASMTVAEQAKYAAEVAKRKADETGVTETTYTMGSNLLSFGKDATSMTKETFNKVSTSAADGTLASKAAE